MAVRNHLSLLLGVALAASNAVALEPSDQLTQYGRQTWQTGSGLPQNTVTAIAQTAEGFLWIGTEEGLARFDGYNFLVYTAQNTPELKSSSIRSLWTDKNGLEIRTGANSLRLNHGSFLPSDSQPPRPDLDSLPSQFRERATCLLRDSHGVLWVGTNKGLMRIRNGVAESFSANDSLSSAAILALFEDREGTLWAGTDDAGLQMVKDQRFATFTNYRVRSVFVDHSGIVWLGTDGDGLKRLEHGAISSITSKQGLFSDVVLSLAEDSGGALLAGTPDGLNVIRKSSITGQTSADGLPEDFIRSLFTDMDGTIWIGTRRGLAHVVGDQVTVYTESNGLGSDLVGAITRDKQGELWIGTLHGLSRWRNGSFTNYTVEDGLGSNVITDLYADVDGYLWIATQGGGLNCFRNEKFAHAGSRRNVPDTLFGVTGDANGNLWLAAPNGILRTSRADFIHNNFTVSKYGTSDGLRIAECSGGGHPALWKTPGGDIWFATARGAALLSSAHANARVVSPAALVETVVVDDAPLSPQSIDRVAAGHARLAFQYAGIDLSDPQHVTYRYKLDGFDGNWIDAGTRRTAFYTNLSPGRYTFRVLARNSEGLWSETAGLYSFRVLPYFYQTWWFRALVAVAILLAVYGAFRWRVKQVRSEFRAVLNERTRIAREIHDTLAQGFAGVSVQLEVVSRLLGPSTEKAREHLDQARMLARTCLEDARRSIWELRSQSAEREDLAARFSNFARTASQNSGIPVQFQVHGTYRQLEPRVEDEILRIGQEAINNAVRHSGAQTIKAGLTFDAKKLRLTVSDDGCGMMNKAGSQDGGHGHYGLTGMRERAESIDAEFSVVSEQGAGTTINVEAPLR